VPSQILVCSVGDEYGEFSNCSGGGFLKQGQYVDAGGTANNRLLNTLISAALQDTRTTVENLGDGAGGMLDVARSR
jgi:hypothetical protein